MAIYIILIALISAGFVMQLVMILDRWTRPITSLRRIEYSYWGFWFYAPLIVTLISLIVLWILPAIAITFWRY